MTRDSKGLRANVSKIGYEDKKPCQPIQLIYAAARCSLCLRAFLPSFLHILVLAMPFAPEALENGASQASQRTQVIRDGDWVIFRLPSGDVKNIKLSKNSCVLPAVFVPCSAHALKAPSLSESLGLSAVMRSWVSRTGSLTILWGKSSECSRQDLWTS